MVKITEKDFSEKLLLSVWKVRTASDNLRRKYINLQGLVKSRLLRRSRIRVTRNLVDPASSHMLVSRIKPCKSESKWFTVDLRTAH